MLFHFLIQWFTVQGMQVGLSFLLCHISASRTPFDILHVQGLPLCLDALFWCSPSGLEARSFGALVLSKETWYIPQPTVILLCHVASSKRRVSPVLREQCQVQTLCLTLEVEHILPRISTEFELLLMGCGGQQGAGSGGLSLKHLEFSFLHSSCYLLSPIPAFSTCISIPQISSL